jgi:hypothetical protein
MVDHTLMMEVVTVTLLEEGTRLLEVGTELVPSAVKVMFKGTLSLQKHDGNPDTRESDLTKIL